MDWCQACESMLSLSVYMFCTVLMLGPKQQIGGTYLDENKTLIIPPSLPLISVSPPLSSSSPLFPYQLALWNQAVFVDNGPINLHKWCLQCSSPNFNADYILWVFLLHRLSKKVERCDWWPKQVQTHTLGPIDNIIVNFPSALAGINSGQDCYVTTYARHYGNFCVHVVGE